jgi:ABC-type phosphate transport system substrate-binding protein
VARSWFAAALLSVAARVSVAAAEPAVRMAGSDLLGPDFTTAVRSYADRRGQELSLVLDGSRDGAEAVAAGRVDVAVLVLRPEETPPQDTYRSVPLGYFVTVVLVPDALPVTQISLAQLAGIFGADAASSHARWDEIGVPGDAASRAIEPQAVAGGPGLALELFRHRVLADGPLKPTVALCESTDVLLRQLTGGPAGGIALVGAMPEPAAGVHALLVAQRDGGVAFGPTPENIHDGDYPLRLTLWLAVRKQFVRDGGLDFLRFLLSDEAAAALTRAGIVPEPPSVRRQTAFDLELP